MPNSLDAIARTNGIDPQSLRGRIDKLLTTDRRRYARLWAYYRNPMTVCAVDGDDVGSDRPYRQAQEWGLPSRITGVRSGGEPLSALRVDGVARKEVVIENDIGWRVETNIDYLFGKPLVIESAAVDPERRQTISQLLRYILASNGGILFLQQLATLGAVYGFVDVLVKLNHPKHQSDADGSSAPIDAPGGCSTQSLGQPPACAHDDSKKNHDEPSADVPTPSASGAEPASLDDAQSNPGANQPSLDVALEHIARMIRLEIVEPARALPFLSPNDYRVVDAYAQCYEMPATACRVPQAQPLNGGWFGKFLRSTNGRFAIAKSAALSFGSNARRDGRVTVVEFLTPDAWQRFEDERLVAEGVNSLGIIPLVHIQNASTPLEYGGSSDVEPLIPLQDELNTRLSDRANRITLQSFKMYLGRGIENFTSLPVAPGRMWMTDNPDANVIEFGGDASCPSEEAHIGELREALDKQSGVTPIAAGAIKGRIGRLTSAAALRVTMLALLAKTEKKRTTYGRGIEQMCELALRWLDRAGLFHTSPEERAIELHWPSPLPENEMEKLGEAEVKARLGVPKEIVLRELGY